MDSRIEQLSPIRRVIITEYYHIREHNNKSKVHVVKELASNLGYKIDKNGSNSFLLEVLRDFFGS